MCRAAPRPSALQPFRSLLDGPSESWICWREVCEDVRTASIVGGSGRGRAACSGLRELFRDTRPRGPCGTHLVDTCGAGPRRECLHV
jgi:hypothetical protein